MRRHVTLIATALICLFATASGCGDDGGSGDGNGDGPSKDSGIQDTGPDTTPPPDTGPTDSSTDSGEDAGPTDTNGTDMTGQDGGVNAPSVDDYTDKAGELLQKWDCKRRWNCPKRYGVSLFTYSKYDSQQACESGDLATEFFESIYKRAGFRADLNAGRIQYDSDLASQCLTELADYVNTFTPMCSQPRQEPTFSSECTNVSPFIGQQQMGQMCRSDEACSGELICDRPEGSCGGQCVTDSDNGGGGGDKMQGETCSNDTECAEGLTCAPDPNNDGQQICDDENSRSPGSECTADDECVPQATCTQNSTCVEFTILSQGANCPTGFNRTEICGPGLVCVPSGQQSGTCEQYREVGDTCSTTNVCRGTLECVGGQCQQPKSAGEGCSNDDECASGTCRMSGVCAPYGREACWSSN